MSVENIKYYIALLFVWPVLPFLYWQGKYVRKRMPKSVKPLEKEGHTGGKGKVELQLLTLGESTMAGVGVASHKEGYVGTLSTQLSKEWNIKVGWNVQARNGATSRALRKNILSRKVGIKSHLLIIALGANDAFHLHSPDYWERQIKKLVACIRMHHPRSAILFLQMPPMKDFPAFTLLMKVIFGSLVNWYAKRLAEISRQTEGVWFVRDGIDLKQEELAEKSLSEHHFSDGMHPSQRGYQLWAENTLQFIRRNPDIQEHLRKVLMEV
jgi:lysophospholipase L1-like esterase